jgi:MinD-like ATPase involved in chromosome partitioning or flagellar assembly
MILYDTFIRLISLLDSKIDDKIIDKYRIAIDQRNEIDVLVISDKDVLKKDFISDEILEGYFNFEKLTNEELEENYFYNSLFQKYGDSIKDVKSSRRKLNNLLSPNTSEMPSLPVVTFYSYKGGMGRSTHLALTATYLARKYSKKIVIIDCDFEAPGFTNFFLEEPNSRFYKNGVIEYFLDKQFDDTISLNQYSWEASKEFSGDGEIRIIPAGNLNPDIGFDTDAIFQSSLDKYLDGLSRFDLSSTDFIVKKFNSLIEDVKKEFNPDAIFIDSRTGFTDVFGITALQLSSQVVGFFNNSVQTEPGLYQFLNSIQELITQKKELNPPIIVNSFSKPKLFRDDFKQKCENIISQYQLFSNQDKEVIDFSLVPFYSYFQYDPTFSDIGTKDEDKIDWLSKIDSGNITGYTDVADKLLESINPQNKHETSSNTELRDNDVNRIQEIKPEENFTILQRNILTQLKEGWPDLYADSNAVNFDEEFENGRFFYRDSMKDIFNFNKFIVLGNKGTGKSYLFQALKENKIVDELKKQAQKTNLNTNFIHLVDKTNNYFISTKFFESYKKEIEQIGDFYTKFWKVYTWKTITEQIIKNEIIDFLPLQVNFSIIADDSQNEKNIINFIKNIDNIIAIEKDLLEIDKQLNTKQIDLIAIYDNLDLMVEPYKWESEIAPLINFWSFTAYKKIHCKLFLRSDLFKKIKGINNIQSLENNTINIEWEKEEIFNYFFNLVKRLAKEDFIKVVELFDFKKISNDDTLWLKDFRKSFDNNKQKQFEEPILRKLCWVFFGQYPDIKAHGESYDWLYKNVMNADNTISIRPFIELIELANEKLIKDNKKISELNYGVLPNEYYTDREVRTNCVKKHFQDLVAEKGNEPLDNIFEYIKDHRDFQFFEFLQRDFYQLLNNVKTEYKLDDSIKNLENLLEINGIIRKTPVGNNIKYSFAFLYKYYLGLGSRGNGNRR